MSQWQNGDWIAFAILALAGVLLIGGHIRAALRDRRAEHELQRRNGRPSRRPEFEVHP